MTTVGCSNEGNGEGRVVDLNDDGMIVQDIE